jgi:hypothetical protein
VLAHEPLQADVDAHLLVGGRHEDQIAVGPEAVTRERRDRDRGCGDVALHVERAAPPDLVVEQLGAPGIALPLGGIGKHRVGVGEQREARPRAPPRKPRDEVGPSRLAGEQLRLDAAFREVLAEQIGRNGLVPGRVDRVESDQRLQELDRLLTKRGDGHQRRRPRTRRKGRCPWMPSGVA